jgi:hypothetical protein
MMTTRSAAGALAALLLATGCAGPAGESGPTPDPSAGGTVSSPSDQPSPTQWDTPALPLPPRSGKPRPGSTPSGTITIAGTVDEGVEPNCVLLNGYLLLGGPRELFVSGARVAVTGRVEPDMMTTCQQGIPLVVESARRG